MGFCWLRMIALPLGQMFYTVQKTTLASLVTFFVCNYVRLGLGRQTAQYRCTASEGEIKEGDVRKPTPMAEQIRTRGVHKWRHHFEVGWVQIWGFVQHFGGYNCTKVLWKLLGFRHRLIQEYHWTRSECVLLFIYIKCYQFTCLWTYA